MPSHTLSLIPLLRGLTSLPTPLRPRPPPLPRRLRTLLVPMHPPHMIHKIIMPREPLPRFRPFASRVLAEIRSGAVTMHTVRFALVAQQTRRGGELQDAAFLVGAAAEGLDVRVDVFVVVALQLGRLVVAVLGRGVGTVVQTIGVRTGLVVGVFAHAAVLCGTRA